MARKPINSVVTFGNEERINDNFVELYGSIFDGTSTATPAALITAGEVRGASANFAATCSASVVVATGLVRGASANFTATCNAGTLVASTAITLPAASVANSALQNGIIVNRAYVENVTQTASAATTTPVDNTAPLITEGNSIFSTTYTPATATNRLRISATLHLGIGTSADHITTALHIGSATAVATVLHYVGTAGTLFPHVLVYEFVPGVTSAVAIDIRSGGAANAISINRASTSALYAGTVRSTLVIEEIKA